ncbi:Gfo/Idh/MocA family oxidoreductase [Polyangium sp. 15x6]|uniref:Gfo/Idh/MocA family protein n=1 Tax=Polyangium sp. 15x6 TaxID=3042687 RepID=UPI00249CE923|nr:Gfo/Idh/MocA family oxidoreductase [Polyangium sp. 15x6]MDI3289284.1 Gfo/Idh/MocA family oxidoreductase [Polyangium sp. 15x6]
MRPLRVGIVGCGRNGLAHAECYRRDDRTVLAAVCDTNEAHREEALARLGHEPAGYARIEDMLARASLDIVSVNTDDARHAAPFLAALSAGCHVFVEKPLADRLEDLDAMVEAALARPAQRTLVGQILRFHPFFREVHRLCSDGTLGRTFYLEADYIHYLAKDTSHEQFNAALGANWHREYEQPAIGGGVHAFDLCRWLSRSNAVEVMSYENRLAVPQMRNADCQVFLARMADGAMCKVASAYGPIGPRPPVSHLSVYGTRGTIRSTDMWLGEGADAVHTSLKDLTRTGYSYELEVEHFVTSILEGVATVCEAVDGANSAAACIIAVQAANTGRAMAVPQYTR